MKWSYDPSAALLAGAALLGAIGCGAAFFGDNGDDASRDAGASLDASMLDGVSPPFGGDGASPDGGPIVETCDPLGATRDCADGAHVQTCLPRESGDGAWSACAPTDCSAASPLPKTTAASCIPAGAFTMGGLQSSGGDAGADTLPTHQVTLKHRFFLDQFEVTVAEFNAFWNAGAPPHPAIGKVIYVSGSGDVLRWSAADDAAIAAPSAGLNCTGGGQKPLASINCVNRATALAYCVSQNARLPTEAEWEYAASGQGKGNSFPWGDHVPTAIEEESCLLVIDSVCVNGTNGGGYPFARPAATKGNTPPELGNLNNLGGNVAEWTLDFAPALGSSCAASDCWPNGARDPWQSNDEAQGAVIRGGSFMSISDQVRSKARAYASPTAPASPASIGFRCAHTD